MLNSFLSFFSDLDHSVTFNDLILTSNHNLKQKSYQGKFQTQASFLLNNVTNMCDTPLDLSLKGLSIDMQHLYVANQIKMYIFKNRENHNFSYILHKYFMNKFGWDNHFFNILNSQSNQSDQHLQKKKISYWRCVLLRRSWRTLGWLLTTSSMSSRRLELNAVFS